MLLNTYGWILSNNEREDTVIQKDDEMNRFKDDDEATEFVAIQYTKAIELCKSILSHIESNLINLESSSYLKDELEQFIKEAKNKSKY